MTSAKTSACRCYLRLARVCREGDLAAQVVKVEPYALLAAHKSLMDLASSLNNPAVESV